MDDTSFIIIGANGQLALALQARYPDAKVLGSQDLDIADPEAVASYDWSGTTTIINAAAYTNVDGAESAEGRIAAWQVNASGTRNLAQVAIQHNLTLVHISTDYVFDGSQNLHNESEPLSPLGVYGQSKAASDIAVSLVPQHYILRTSWVIGEGKNFVRTMLGLGAKGIAPTVVSDQIGRLSFTSEIVRAIDHLLVTKAAYGTYNVSNGGQPASWSDITRDIFRLAGYDLTVSDTSTTDYFQDKPQAAPRPLQSSLDLAKLEASGFVPRDWREDLKLYIDKEKQQ